MRFLQEIYRGIRSAVGDDYPVSVKLNSADFQKGGFDEADSIKVLQALQEDGIDLIEISGGNYAIKLRKLSTGLPKLDAMTMLDITWYEHQLERIGKGKAAKPGMSAWTSVMKTFGALGALAFQRRRA